MKLQLKSILKKKCCDFLFENAQLTTCGKLTGMKFHMLGAACELALIHKKYQSNPKSQVRATVIIIYSDREFVMYCAQY